jgi:hypothetical protein
MRSEAIVKRNVTGLPAQARPILAALVSYGPIIVVIVAALNIRDTADLLPHRQRAVDEQLWAAAQCGDVRALEGALAAGADIDARDEMGNPALLIAACADRPDAARVLASRGAEVNVFNSGYGTPLRAAVRHRDTRLLEALLDAGANPNCVEENGLTALRAATASGEPRIIELINRALVKRGRRQDARP